LEDDLEFYVTGQENSLRKINMGSSCKGRAGSNRCSNSERQGDGLV